MEYLMMAWNWYVANAAELGVATWAIVGAAEVVVRLTPTQTDDGFVSRIGKWLDTYLPSKLKRPPPKP